MFYKTDALFSKDIISGSRKTIGIHYHSSYELYLLLDGTVKYLVDDKFFYLSKWDLIIIPPRALHSTDSESCLHNERLLINFDESNFFPETEKYLNLICRDKIIILPKEKHPLIEDMFYKVESEYKHRNEGGNELIKLYISELIMYLYRYKTIPKDAPKPTDIIIQQVAEYIFENYSQDLSLAALSYRFNLSECYLSRKFKTETGSSINQYINSVRIARAKDLLKKPFGSVTDVATSCGFNDSNYFSNVFKKMNGITPLKYSKQYKN